MFESWSSCSTRRGTPSAGCILHIPRFVEAFSVRDDTRHATTYGRLGDPCGHASSLSSGLEANNVLGFSP